MPPVNQGSRSTLFMWTATATILAVVCAIFAIVFYVNSTKADDQVKSLGKQYEKVTSKQNLTNQQDEIQKLLDARSDPTRGLDSTMMAFQVALAERNNLAKLI